MKHIFYLVFIFSLLSSELIQAQIENVIVERYYVSDANDATDTTGGILEEGSVTYRVYIDLMPGCKLRKIYGDANHVLRFSSTAVFFNNTVDGLSFAKDFPKNRLGENTVALDSWITLGQTTRTSAKTNFGVLKTADRDGSFIGGSNNDGGSAGISTGLLVNTDPAAGIPIVTFDGMDTMNVVPASWGDYGITDIAGADSTIFGSLKHCSEFISNNAGLQNSGVSGVIPADNQVLVAQLTTKGEISFEINVEVEVPGIINPVKYVAKLANGESNSDTLKLSPFLKYPAACGCTDPNYLEYNAAYACNNSDSCLTAIIFGCTDSLACNYDPTANFNIQALCCYPGYCSDRDISVVCPQLNVERYSADKLNIYPNPVKDIVTLQFSADKNSEAKYSIYDSEGKLIFEKNMGIISGTMIQNIDLSALNNGMYMIRLFVGDNVKSKSIIKIHD